VRLSFGGLAIDVTGDARPALDWLGFFLEPWFCDEQPTRAQRTTELAIDRIRLHEMQAAIAADNPRLVGCFLLDSRVVGLPAITRPDGQTWIDDRDLDVVYEVHHRGVRIVAAADGPGPRVAVMRVVRELASLNAARSGSCLLHAAVTAFDNGGLAICGPKRAGKTTLLISLLTSAGARFVANDRAVATPHADGVELKGIPTIVAIRGDTIERFPGLSPRLRDLPDRHWLTPSEARSHAGRPWRTPGTPIDLAPRAFCDALGVAAQGSTDLRAVVLPRIDTAATRASALRLSRSDVSSRLGSVLVGGALPDVAADALWPSAEPSKAALALDALAALPWFELVIPATDAGVPALPPEIAELVA